MRQNTVHRSHLPHKCGVPTVPFRLRSGQSPHAPCHRIWLLLAASVLDVLLRPDMMQSQAESFYPSSLGMGEFWLGL